MEKDFLTLCVEGVENPQNWERWLSDRGPSDENRKAELLGLSQEEFDDLNQKMRSMNFYVFKRKNPRSSFRVFPGAYVRFAFEHELQNPHFEMGWVDLVEPHRGFCRIQVDDEGDFNGSRAITLRIADVMEILPMKERPLVYYKSMVCGKCNDCDRMRNADVPTTCPHFDFMRLVLKKQKADKELIGVYKGGKLNDLFTVIDKIDDFNREFIRQNQESQNQVRKDD